MRILVLSALAAAPEAGRPLEALLQAEANRRGWALDSVDVTALNIRHCLGCAACSKRTPGICAIPDDMQHVLPRIVTSDCVVLATPIRFGGHHHTLKRVLDRVLPLASPVWVRRARELHNRMRYSPMPSLLGLGWQTDDAPGPADTFRFLIQRHAVNLDLPRHASVVCGPSALNDGHRASLAEALDTLEVLP